MSPPADPDRFGILFVCTGNICRSPYAERFARRHLADSLGGDGAGRFELASAGTHALVGSGMDLLADAELRASGGSSDGFAARQIDVKDIAAAELVLTAERAHRAYVAQTLPRALRTTFTLREFARLLDAGLPGRRLPDDPVARARLAVAIARTARGTLEQGPPGDDDVPDPYGLPAEAHHQTATIIAAALTGIVKVMLVGAAA
jgi:protein-tyrosine phosphatase